MRLAFQDCIRGRTGHEGSPAQSNNNNNNNDKQSFLQTGERQDKEQKLIIDT